jgi:hypothetical protein
MAKKSLHLLWSEGFALRLGVTVAIGTAACAGGWQNHDVQLKLMQAQSWICKCQWIDGSGLCDCSHPIFFGLQRRS